MNNINSSTSSSINQTYTTDQVARPDGARLFNNLATDNQSQYTGEPLSYRNQEAHNPQLNVPQDVPKNAPMQDDAPSMAELMKEYQAAVLAGINSKSADKQQASKLSDVFFSRDDSTLDEASREMLRDIMADSQKEVNEKNKRNADDPIPDDDSGQSASQAMKENGIRNEMKNYPDLFVNGKLSDKGNRLLHAMMTGGADGDPQAQAIMKAVTEKIGFTPGVDASYFDAKIGMEFEEAFKAQIANLPPDQQKKMEYLFNMDPTHPDVKAYIDKATAQIQGKWGADINIVTENLSFTYQLNGEYQIQLDKNIKELAPQLFQSDINVIKNYLSTGKGEISPELKAIADKASAATMAYMQSTQGVPKNWTPDPSISFNTFSNTAQAKAYFALNDQIVASQVRLNSLPNGPEKNQVAQLLKIISQALSELKQMLFQAAAEDAAGSAQMSRAQVDLVKDKTSKAKAVQSARETERKAQEEVDRKEAENAKKNEWLQPLMIAAGAILAAISVVVTALTFGAAAGLIALAVTILVLILTLAPSGEVDEKGNSMTLMNSAMKGLNKAIDVIANGIFGEGSVMAKLLGTYMRLGLLVLAVAASRGNMAVITPLIISFIVESGFVERIMGDLAIAMTGGKPSEELSYAAAAINAVLMIAITVIAAKSGGPQTAARFAKLDKLLHLEKATTWLRGSEKGREAIQAGLLTAEAAATGMQISVTVVQGYNEIELGKIQERLAKVMRDTAGAENKIEELEVMIKMLQKVINAMFGQIDDMMEWAQDTGKQVDQRWADKTELMTNLNSAQ
jgi:hypothetical protein